MWLFFFRLNLWFFCWAPGDALLLDASGGGPERSDHRHAGPTVKYGTGSAWARGKPWEIHWKFGDLY